MSCASDTIYSSAGCPNAESLLPIDPFTALEVSFGMLLGVDDIETLSANPRGKLRLHNAWLHGAGVVWGLSIALAADRGELQVSPGLALDAVGHELHVDVPSCVNLSAWFDAHKSDTGFNVVTSGTRVTFDAHVVLKFKACLTRPVPSIADTCQGGTSDVTYSRAFETVEIVLAPNLSSLRPRRYHRLRLLFGLDDPALSNGSITLEDAAIVARRDDIRLNHPPEEQPKLYLAALREYAALDTAALAPAVDSEGTTQLFPENEPSELVLGDVRGVTLEKAADGSFSLVTPLPELLLSVRPTLIDTATIQELLCGPLFGSSSGSSSGGGTSGGTSDAGGPRFDPGTASFAGRTIQLKSTSALAPASLDSRAFAVTAYDDGNGWSDTEIRSVAVDASATTVTIELKEDPAGALVRVVAFGKGARPILGSPPSFVPLAGSVGGPAGGANEGNDFTFTWRRS